MESGISTARLNPDLGERFLALRRELGLSSFGLNQIVLEPGQRGRIHRHREQEEVYIVLHGRLSVLVEGEEHVLERGGLMRVGPEVRRQLVNYGPERVLMLALGGAGEHVGRDGEAFESWDATAAGPPQEMPLPADLDASELRS
jgi:mannose-6-phosphate isomerase-like protein (cupin superfamily)